MNIYLCPSPELYSLYHRPDTIVIIVDIFRASTTMVTALGHGARSIIPVSTTEEAETLGHTLGCLIAAERNVQRCPFAQLGNDPAEYTEELVSGKDIVFTTTNGTRALNPRRSIHQPPLYPPLLPPAGEGYPRPSSRLERADGTRGHALCWGIGCCS